MRTTSAPMSASSAPQNGAGPMAGSSSTCTPLRGPGIAALQFAHYRTTIDYRDRSPRSTSVSSLCSTLVHYLYANRLFGAKGVAMKAAVLETRGRDGLFLRDVAVPARRAGEVLLRVHAAGLNRVDLYMRDNGVGITHSLPMTLGVEAAGVVVEADPGSALKPGRKAVVYSNAFCGACRYCLAGDQPLCLRAHIMGEHRDGGFAEYLVMPERCVLPLPDDADLAEAGALLAAYLTAWRMLFGKRALRTDETVLVAGVGGGVAVAC